MLDIKLSKLMYCSLFHHYGNARPEFLNKIEEELKNINQTQFTVNNSEEVYDLNSIAKLFDSWEEDFGIFKKEETQRQKNELEKELKFAYDNFDKLEKISLSVPKEQLQDLYAFFGKSEDFLRGKLALLGYALTSVEEKEPFGFNDKMMLSNGKEVSFFPVARVAKKDEMHINCLDFSLEEVK